MNLSLFIAKRIYNNQGDKQKVSRPVISIATIGVAIGLAVMIITVSVVFGFKHTIRDKVIGFSNHIQVANFLTLQGAGHHPVCIDDSLEQSISAIEGVGKTDRYTVVQGILKTDGDFKGISFKGIGPQYRTEFLQSCLSDGVIPQFSDSSSTNQLVISQNTADKLHLNVGDKLFAYFVFNDDVRARRFTVKGIFQTNMAQFDESLCLIDIYTANKLNGWNHDQCTGLELSVTDFTHLEETASNVRAKINRTFDKDGNPLGSLTIHEMHPQIFTWLDLLDLNVWIILVLMVCVAGFTMISGLLIIILERVQMIGTLKALGTDNTVIRHTFLWFATFIIGRGLLIGNIIGIGVVLLQIHTGIISLDPTNYYVDKAPMELNLPVILLLNIATLLICILVLILPSYMISRIHPAKSMRYE